MISFDSWCIMLALCVMALVLFAGVRRPGWKDLLALRLVLCSYLVLLIQGAVSGLVGGATWSSDTIVALLSLIAWLWGGVRVLVCRSSRYRAHTLICWVVYLLLGLVGAVA